VDEGDLRLSMLDNSFLVYENEDAGMHMASTQIFEAEPLRGSDGNIDIDLITDYVYSHPTLSAAYSENAHREASGMGR